MVFALFLMATSGVLAEDLATGHVRYHAIIGGGALAIAGALVWSRRVPTLAKRALVVGLLVLAAAQFIEGIGAFGYGPDNDTRRHGIVVAHDLGLAATAIALLALAAALAVAAGSLARTRLRAGTAGPVAIAIAIVVGIAGVLAVMVVLLGSGGL